MVASGSIVGGRYRVLEQIGEGGMGAIYAAEHTGTRQRVALKVLTVDSQRKLDEAVQRFHAEARTASALGSAHIVQVYDVGVDEQLGVPFMALELLEGEDLDTLLRRIGPLQPQAALRVIAQAAEGLREAHANAVVHRDIKPANIFLSRDGDGVVTVKLLDFGIAKVRRELVGTENVGLTRTGSVLGTPMYMSPEQAIGMKTIDARSDIWSLGTVLYATLAGSPPYRGLDTLGKLILSVCSRPVPPLQQRAPWVDADLARIAHRALKKEADARYQTCGQMHAALLACLEGEPELRAEMLEPVPDALRETEAPPMSLEPDAQAMLLSPTAIEALLDGASGPIEELTDSLLGATDAATDEWERSETVDAEPQPATKRDGAASASAPGKATPDEAEADVLRTDLDMTSPLSAAVVARKPRASRLPLLLAVGLLVGVGAVALAVQLSSTPAPATATSAAASTSSAAPAQEVTVAIDPPDATVTVDGARVAVDGGRITLRGELGSSRSVVVVSGDRSKTQKVGITGDGATPDRIALPAVVAGATASPAASSAATAAGPSTAPRPTPVPRASPKTKSPKPKDSGGGVGFGGPKDWPGN